jgi:hypothetical protein
LAIEALKQKAMIGRLLKQRFGEHAMVDASGICSTPHLDDDSLNAFVEGRLGERELPPVLMHLIECGGCRQSSASLLRLSAEIESELAPAPITQREPGRFKKFLDDLVARVVAQDESSVFAYHAPGEEGAKEEKESDTVESRKTKE